MGIWIINRNKNKSLKKWKLSFLLINSMTYKSGNEVVDCKALHFLRLYFSRPYLIGFISEMIFMNFQLLLLCRHIKTKFTLWDDPRASCFDRTECTLWDDPKASCFDCTVLYHVSWFMHLNLFSIFWNVRCCIYMHWQRPSPIHTIHIHTVYVLCYLNFNQKN